MLTKTFSRIALLGASTLILSGCAIASGMNDAEKDIAADLSTSKYQPASREARDNMSTQDNFAKAAFWSHEYHLNPADLEAAIKLAAAVRKMGNPGKAIEITQTTRALYPKDPYLTAEYAAALIASERSEDAITALDDGLRAAPGYGRLWSLKGAALDQLESYDLARKHYGRALQITPNDPNVMANLGLSYALAGDPQTAETWLRRASVQPGAGINIRQNLALVMQLQGKSTEAFQKQEGQSQPAQTHAGYQQQPQSNAALRGSPPMPRPRYRQDQQAPNLPAPNQTVSPYQSYASAAPSQPQNFSSSTAPYRSQAQPQNRQTQQQPTPSNFAARQRQVQTGQPQRQMPAQRQPSYNPAQSNYTARQPTQRPALSASAQAAASYSQGLESRSNFTVVGNQEGAPQSAAEAARAAAAQSGRQNRRMVVPAAANNVNAEQANILSQIARNVGPRPTSLAAAPSANPEDNFSVQPETLSQRGQPGVISFQQHPTAENPYAQNTAPQHSQQARTRRGAARRR